MVGMSDQSHLTRHFKRIAGITPGRYRNMSISFKLSGLTTPPLHRNKSELLLDKGYLRFACKKSVSQDLGTTDEGFCLLRDLCAGNPEPSCNHN